MATRILVVEDDTVMRRLLLKVLGREGYAVAGAASAVEAVTLLDGIPFELLVSDIRMSSMSGLELASRTKAACPQTKVLLITAYGEDADARRAHAAGADGYLNKPFAMGRLLAMVRALVGGRRARPKGRAARN